MSSLTNSEFLLFFSIPSVLAFIFLSFYFRNRTTIKTSSSDIEEKLDQTRQRPD